MDAHAIDKHYTELTNTSTLLTTIHSYISEYNEYSKSKRFSQALDLLLKINRIISRPQGNCVLVGLGGSGRRTMTRLAAFMQDYQCYEIELSQEFGQNDWYEFLRNMIRKIVLENKKAVFLIAEEQLVNEKGFEDLNNLLNLGEVPNLYDTDEKESVSYFFKLYINI